MDDTPQKGWNYRVVAEWVRGEVPALSGWSYSIRDVYYEDGETTMWGAEAQYPCAECYDDLKADHDLMGFAFNRSILVVDGDGLVTPLEYKEKYGRTIPVTVDSTLELHRDRKLDAAKKAQEPERWKELKRESEQDN